MLGRIAVAAVAACLLAGGATALTPVVSGTRGAQIAATGPIGQSFVADDAQLTSFGFQFALANNVTAAPLTFELRRGAGLTGMLLASVTGTPTPTGRTGIWYDFALSGVTLTVGQSYTALVSTTSTRLALLFGPTLNTSTGAPLSGDAYAGGMLVSTNPVDTGTGTTGYCATSGACDANFRVNALAAAVPEPATWASLTFGFLLTGAALRRRDRRDTVPAA